MVDWTRTDQCTRRTLDAEPSFCTRYGLVPNFSDYLPFVPLRGEVISVANMATE